MIWSHFWQQNKTFNEKCFSSQTSPESSFSSITLSHNGAPQLTMHLPTVMCTLSCKSFTMALKFSTCWSPVRTCHHLSEVWIRMKSWKNNMRTHVHPWKINGCNLEIYTQLKRKIIWSKPSFSGSMLIFRGVPSLKLMACPWKYSKWLEDEISLFGWPIFGGYDSFREYISWYSISWLV